VAVILRGWAGARTRARTFEQLAQGLDQLELHVLEQAADVVVRLDGGTWALEADTLDDVWVERALEQPLDLALVRLCSLELGGLSFEHVDERVADDASLLLRVLDAVQTGEEELRRVDDGQVHAQILVEHLVHLPRLVEPEHAVIYHDSVEPNSMVFFKLMFIGM
jgi:hypothetical protein